MHSITITEINDIGNNTYRVRFDAVAEDGTVYKNNHYQWEIPPNSPELIAEKAIQVIDYLVSQKVEAQLPDPFKNLIAAR